MRSLQTYGVSLVLCAAMLWGTTGTAQSFAELTLSSYWLGTARLLVASCFFLMWIAVSDQRTFLSTNTAGFPWKFIVTAALCMAAYNLTFFAGIRVTSVALGTAIALGSAPVWAGTLQAVWLGRQPSRRWWLAVSVVITGLLTASLTRTSMDSTLSITGVLLCLSSGLCYALYALVSKQLVGTAPTIVITSMVFTTASLAALPAALILAGPPQIALQDVPVILWLGIPATGVAYLLFNLGLRYISGATGVALALAEPAAALLLAVVIVGERLSLAAVAGTTVMFAGLYMLVRSEYFSTASKPK